MSPLSEFLVLVNASTAFIIFYSIKQFQKSNTSKLFNTNSKQMENPNTKTIEKEKLVAETLNGRFAMIGLIAALGAYLTTGQIIPGFV